MSKNFPLTSPARSVLFFEAAQLTCLLNSGLNTVRGVRRHTHHGAMRDGVVKTAHLKCLRTLLRSFIRRTLYLQHLNDGAHRLGNVSWLALGGPISSDTRIGTCRQTSLDDRAQTAAKAKGHIHLPPPQKTF